MFICLVRKSGTILLESVPTGVSLSDVKYDLELVWKSPGQLLWPVAK